ncbi:unnamed protein product [Ectocarpus sp. CCAP 1310/34]|nr:unnamed protein product [Ectocarpus sp. CCAP 1310/34]
MQYTRLAYPRHLPPRGFLLTPAASSCLVTYVPLGKQR